MELSADLVSWAELAGFTYSHVDDAAMLYSSGGETCYYIRSVDNGSAWLDVTETDRGGDDEQFIFSAASLDILERFFWVKFGFSIRMSRHLPRLVFPTKIEEIPPGYEVKAESNAMLILVDAEGLALARSRNSSSGTFLLVKLASVLGFSVEDLRASYLHPDGHPIFPRQRG